MRQRLLSETVNMISAQVELLELVYKLFLKATVFSSSASGFLNIFMNLASNVA